MSEHSFLVVCLAAALLGSAFLTTNTFSQAARAGKATLPSPVRVADARAASLAEFEDRMAAALAAAEAALASEEARLDGLAEHHSRRTLADGSPSVAQAAANARLWDRRIREMETDERELREALTGMLASLDADIASLTQRLSAQRETAELERIAREKAQRERVQRERAETARRAREKAEGTHPVGRVFRDCEDCPEMVVVPSGNFKMGSPASEKWRNKDEGPTHLVTIGYRFAVGVREVTRGEFGRFVSATNRVIGELCWTWEDKWRKRSGVGWRNPGFSQADDHPVVCVNWNDAKAYVRWLSERTGKGYRLLSEAEWEYAARGGTMGPFHFGATISTDQANYNGHYTYGAGGEGVYRKKTVPVGSFPANGFGLHDVHGNVWEWVEDCWHVNYDGAPTDGSARTSRGNCGRVMRGGSWSDAPGGLRSALRRGSGAGNRIGNLGFRVARTLAR